MWNCPKCNAEVDDGFEVCWSCGTAADGTEDPGFVPELDVAESPPPSVPLHTWQVLFYGLLLIEFVLSGLIALLVGFWRFSGGPHGGDGLVGYSELVSLGLLIGGFLLWIIVTWRRSIRQGDKKVEGSPAPKE